MMLAVAIAALGANMNGKYSVASVNKQDVPFNDVRAGRGKK